MSYPDSLQSPAPPCLSFLSPVPGGTLRPVSLPEVLAPLVFTDPFGAGVDGGRLCKSVWTSQGRRDVPPDPCPGPQSWDAGTVRPSRDGTPSAQMHHSADDRRTPNTSAVTTRWTYLGCHHRLDGVPPASRPEGDQSLNDLNLFKERRTETLRTSDSSPREWGRDFESQAQDGPKTTRFPMFDDRPVTTDTSATKVDRRGWYRCRLQETPTCVVETCRT